MSIEQKLLEWQSTTLNGFERINARLKNLEQENTRPGGLYEHAGGEMLMKTIVSSPDFEQFKARGFRGKMSLPLGKSFFSPEYKTTITSAAVGSSTPGILIPERIPGIVKPGIEPVRVRDLFPRIKTQNNAVEWV